MTPGNKPAPGLLKTIIIITVFSVVILANVLILRRYFIGPQPSNRIMKRVVPALSTLILDNPDDFKSMAKLQSTILQRVRERGYSYYDIKCDYSPDGQLELWGDRVDLFMDLYIDLDQPKREGLAVENCGYLEEEEIRFLYAFLSPLGEYEFTSLDSDGKYTFAGGLQLCYFSTEDERMDYEDNGDLPIYYSEGVTPNWFIYVYVYPWA